VVRNDVQCKCFNNNLWRGHRAPRTYVKLAHLFRLRH
jgi:hypothetical protein